MQAQSACHAGPDYARALVGLRDSGTRAGGTASRRLSHRTARDARHGKGPARSATGRASKAPLPLPRALQTLHGRGIASSLGQAASLTGTYPFSFQGLPVTDPCRGVQSSPNPETRGPHGGPPSGLRNRPCAKDEAARASNHPDWLAGAAMAQPRSVRGVLAARRVHVHVYLPPPSVKTPSRIDLSLYPSERERQVQQQDNGCALRFSGPSGPELSPQRGQGDHGPRAGSKQTRPTCGF